MSKAGPFPDPGSALGRRVRERLREAGTAWLVTTGVAGAPHPNPVWFWWDEESILIYSLPTAKRLANIRRQPLVALHFDSDGRDGDVIVINGRAEISPGDPPATTMAGFLAKYRNLFLVPPEQWARTFTVPIRVHPERVRGWLHPSLG